MSSRPLVLLCMVLVSLLVVLQGVSAARDLTHVARYGNYFVYPIWVHIVFFLRENR